MMHETVLLVLLVHVEHVEQVSGSTMHSICFNYCVESFLPGTTCAAQNNHTLLEALIIRFY